MSLPCGFELISQNSNQIWRRVQELCGYPERLLFRTVYRSCSKKASRCRTPSPARRRFSMMPRSAMTSPPSPCQALLGAVRARESETNHPTPCLTPDPPVLLLAEHSYEPTGSFGAQSIGEIVINTPAPAIAHAIYRATGVWHRELPILPEHILLAKPETD